MMPHFSARAAVTTLVVSTLLLLSSAAFAQLTVSYLGETPSTGITGYSGGSSTLWDYVYQLIISTPSSTPGPGTYWAIVCDFAPTKIVASSGWQAWGWDDQITDSEYHGAFAGTALIGKPAVVWEWDVGGGTGPFHFQSSWAPGLRPWATYATTRTEGTEWSATPEPASTALTSLCLIGVAVWRRRRSA